MPDPKSAPRGFRMTRRRMVLGGGLTGGALAIGYAATHPMEVAAMVLSGGSHDPEPSAFGAYIRIAADGMVTIVNKQQELGQGIHAALAAMIAEELDADWNRVRVVPAEINFRAYGVQLTYGSFSVSTQWDAMRLAGAAARAMFVAAAARRWRVPRASIGVRDGIVSHPASGRSAPFAVLLADAARETPPQQPRLKQPAEYRLIGTDRVRRKDAVPKSTGAQVYTQDIQRSGMLFAVLARSPRFGGRLARFDDRAARQVAGVVDVFATPAGVAVVAENSFAALRARAALRTEWDDRQAERRSTPEIVEEYHRIALGNSTLKPDRFLQRGDADRRFGEGQFEAAFDFPYLAHAPMETLDCVAQVDGWQVRIASGSHLATGELVNAAIATPTIPGKVELEVLPAGGSFGRRGAAMGDYVAECVQIARRLQGRPVKLFWSREDDLTGGYYRPMAHHRVWIETGADGLPTAWRHHIVAQQLLPFGANSQNYEGVKDSPYLAAASTVDCKIFTPKSPVTATFWRSVGHSHSAMVMEHVVDQLARRAARDPADYRRVLYRRAGATRHLAVLDAVCREAGWWTSIDAGWARGLAVQDYAGTVVGQVAEVRLEAGRPVVRRVVAAVDCGIAISPDQISAQMEGGIGFGLSAALYGAITLKDGIVEQRNFDGYRVARMDDMPRVETHILRSTAPPTGMGEPGVPPIAPAIANAILALTGQPTRRLPFVGTDN